MANNNVEMPGEGKSKTAAKRRPVVIIVGGNFAGMAALERLEKDMHLFERVILIDQKDYFEYTPGVLRLFCEPQNVNSLCMKLSSACKHPSFQFIHGKVTRIIGDDGFEKRLSYLPKCIASEEAVSIETIQYDFLIFATGAAYVSPIHSSSIDGTLTDRRQEWIDIHRKLNEARSVVILGAGAVGVELAAEIVDHYDTTKQVVLIDAASRILRLFPNHVSEYAFNWLRKKQVDIRLNQKLTSWTAKSCIFSDGASLDVDIVYNCGGSTPNSTAIPSNSPNFGFTSRKNILVEPTLQIRGGGDGCLFACGDIAHPPSGYEKQALQAESQGRVAAHNLIILASQKAQRLRRYPNDLLSGESNQMPLVADVSLGRYDGIVVFNGLYLPGRLAAVAKWLLESTKMNSIRGGLMGKIIWMIADPAVLLLSSTIIKPNAKKDD